MDISPDDYKDFLDNHYKPKAVIKDEDGNNKPLLPPALYLKQYLKSKLETILSKAYQDKEEAKRIEKLNLK